MDIIDETPMFPGAIRSLERTARAQAQPEPPIARRKPIWNYPLDPVEAVTLEELRRMTINELEMHMQRQRAQLNEMTGDALFAPDSLPTGAAVH